MRKQSREKAKARPSEVSRKKSSTAKRSEASLSFSGHNKDILIDKNGNVVEVEEQVALDSLPSTVQDALKKAAGTGTISVIESSTKNGKLVAYEAQVKHGQKRSEIQVGPNGERLKREE